MLHTRPRRVAAPSAAAACLLSALLASCSEDKDTDPSSDGGPPSDAAPPSADPQGPFQLTVTTPPPASAPAGQPLDAITIEVLDRNGDAAPGISVGLSIERGGGHVDETPVRTDGIGHAQITWTLGNAPVDNELAIIIVATPPVEGDGSNLTVRGTLEAPLEPEPFGDVDAFLTEASINGSTEDLAFDGASRLMLGVPGAILAMGPDGAVKRTSISGETLDGALGVAFDRDGNLWIADNTGNAVRWLDPDGGLHTAFTAVPGPEGERDLEGPNHIAIGPRGRVFVSDPCLGVVIRYDPSSEAVEAVHEFDLPTEGGPNGLAFDASGDTLYVVTENTGILCGHAPTVEISASLAGLFHVEVTADGFGPRAAVATGLGLFGDGLTFDIEGNLYVVVDTQEGMRLDQSLILVLPRGDTTLVPLLAVTDRAFANVAFGSDAFGATHLYIALIALPPYTPASARGVERFDVGIRGLPLLPDDG